jgi:peptidoglycan/LPS O-acetylase OafA/YrhL
LNATRPSSSDKSLPIELLRAGCVLWIVGFWHLMNYTHGFPGADNAVTLRLTVIVLGLFTFVSGFLLARAPMRLRAPKLGRFYARRLLRIYPLYLLALLAFWALGMADRSTALKAALGMSMVYGPAPLTLWFITMILEFYLVAPLLVALRGRPALFALAAAGLFGVAAVCGSAANGDLRLAEYFPAFALGVYWAGHGERASTRTTLWACAATAAAWAWSLAASGDPQYSLTGIPLVTCGALAAFLLAGRLTLSPRGALARAAALVSYASFAMYLFHRVVYKGLHALYDPASPGLGLAWLLLVGLPVVIAVALVAQRACDAAFQGGTGRRLRHWTRRARPGEPHRDRPARESEDLPPAQVR